MTGKGKGKGRGIRQKLGIKKKSNVVSADTAHLTRMYARGKLTASEVGQSAAATSSAHPYTACSLTKRLAKAARTRPASKKIRRNSAKIVKRGIASHATAVLSEPYIVDTPVWDRVAGRQVLRPVAFLPPHEVLDKVVAEGEENKWGSLEEDHQSGLKAELQEWAARIAVDLATAVPWLCMALWGDSAPLTSQGRNALYLLTFTVLSGEFRKRFWLFACTKRDLCDCGCAGKCTLDEAWKVVAWSCRALLAGRWPATDHRDEPWTAKDQPWRAKMAGKRLRFRGAVLAKCGDWAWFKSALNLRGWKGDRITHKMCWLCNASFSGPCDCFDFSQTAQWRQQMVSQSAAIAEAAAARYPSAIWQIPGLTISMFKPDWMHCSDLGILQMVMGNIMWELLVELGGTMRSPKPACAKLLAMSKVMARQLGVEPPFTALTYGMIRTAMKKGPSMRLKAAEGRHYLPILRAILINCFDMATAHAKLRFDCLDHLHNCYEELRTWQNDGSSALKLSTSARMHLLLYKQLHEQRTHEKAWKLAPKHHLWLHCAEHRATNPMQEWNYRDEDEIGKAVEIGSGVNPARVRDQLLPRYAITFSFL